MRTPFHLRLMRTVTLDRKHQQARPSARPAQHVPTGAAVGLVLCRDCGHLFPQCHCEYSPVPTVPLRVLTSTHIAIASTHQYPQCHCEYSPVPTVPLRVLPSTHSATASTYQYPQCHCEYLPRGRDRPEPFSRRISTRIAILRHPFPRPSVRVLRLFAIIDETRRSEYVTAGSAASAGPACGLRTAGRKHPGESTHGSTAGSAASAGPHADCARTDSAVVHTSEVRPRKLTRLPLG
jgi:hypothetical protein